MGADLSRPHRRWTEALRVRNAGILYALLLLVAVLAVATEASGRPGYLSGDNIANILDQASLTAILAIFMTVVLISGNFDLSVASVAALAGAAALSVVDEHGFVIALALGLACGLVVGALNGIIVQYVGINAFIVTLGTLTAVRGLVLILTDGRSVTASEEASFDAFTAVQGSNWTLPNLLPALGAALVLAAGWRLRRSRDRRALPMLAAGIVLVAVGFAADWGLRFAKPVFYMGAIALVVWAVLRFTVVGRRLYAVGANAEAARLSGIRVNRYKVVPFALSGLAAGLVGVLSGAKLGAINPTALQGEELTVLAAAILGGTSLFGGSGSVLNSVIGALFLFTIANGFNVLNLGANYQGLIEGVVIVIAAAVYTLAQRRERQARPDQPSDGVAASTSTAPEPVRAGT